MDVLRSLLAHHWQELVIPLAVLAVTLAAGYAAKRLLFRALAAWANRTKSSVATVLLQSLSGPFTIWVLILGVHLATQSSALPPRASSWVARTLLVLWIASLTLMAARLAGDLIRLHGAPAGGAMAVTSLTQNLAQLAVIILGIVVLLNQLGISITPILTALGVGGLAVALALQDTLSNLFAGFYISVAGQIRLGDYIKLNSGEEGYVTDITWRITTVRPLANNLIIIPNAKLSQAIVTNYHLPDKRMALPIRVGVSYDCDPDHVERVLVETATEAVGQIPGLLAQPAPAARFSPGFGDSSLDFTLVCHVQEFTDQFLVQHELRKRIFNRFRREGIEIPFPVRTVHLRADSASR